MSFWTCLPWGIRSLAERANAMLRAWFGLVPPQAPRSLQILTPGDLAVARQKAEILGNLTDPDALYTLLKSECWARPNQPRPIRFVA